MTAEEVLKIRLLKKSVWNAKGQLQHCEELLQVAIKNCDHKYEQGESAHNHGQCSICGKLIPDTYID